MKLIEFFLPLFLLGLSLNSKILYPVSLGVVRSSSISGNLQDYMSNIGLPSLNDNGHNVGYNVICLDGFKTDTTFSTLGTDLSPLGTWVNIYSRILANTKNLIGSTSAEIQQFILQRFHNYGAKLLMNAFSFEQPISDKQSDATIMADRITSFVADYHFDGVSIDFEDFHSVKNREASAWLRTLLKNLRQSMPLNKIIALQIHPTLLKQIDLFESSEISSFVDIFVLKYYNLVESDYTSYQAIFTQAQLYESTAMWEIQMSSRLGIDICRTVVAKPAVVSSTWNRNSFVPASNLSDIFLRAKNELGWFGGFANLDLGSDSSAQFQLVALNQLRNDCYRFENCYCH